MLCSFSRVPEISKCDIIIHVCFINNMPGCGGARLAPKASGSLPAPQSEHAIAIEFFGNFPPTDDILGQRHLSHIHHRVILHLSSKFQLIRSCGLAIHSQTNR